MKGLPWWLSGNKYTCSAGDASSVPGLGRSPGEGNVNPLQYSCLGNPMDRGQAGYSPWGRRSVRHDLVNDLPPYVMKGFLNQNKNQSKARSPRGRTVSHQIMISCSKPNLQICHCSENDNATFPISACAPSPLFW